MRYNIGMRIIFIFIALLAFGACGSSLKEVKTNAKIFLSPGTVCYAQRRTLMPNGDIKVQTVVTECPKARPAPR